MRIVVRIGVEEKKNVEKRGQEEEEFREKEEKGSKMLLKSVLNNIGMYIDHNNDYLFAFYYQSEGIYN